VWRVRISTQGPGGDDKCGFVSIGTGTYDPSPQLLAAYRNDPEAGVKMNVDDFVLNMKASGAFDQCYTFTYTTERTLPMVQQALTGVRQALVRPLWADADTTLDTEFNKITSSLVEGTIFVKSHLRSFESDLLAGFKTGLASGRVGAIVRPSCPLPFWLAALLDMRAHADDRVAMTGVGARGVRVATRAQPKGRGGLRVVVRVRRVPGVRRGGGDEHGLPARLHGEGKNPRQPQPWVAASSGRIVEPRKDSLQRPRRHLREYSEGAAGLTRRRVSVWILAAVGVRAAGPRAVGRCV